MKNWQVKFFMIMVAVWIISSGSLQAQTESSAANFFKNKTITIVINSNIGAANDIIARSAAPYLSKLTGAQVIVENKPAAGGLQAVNDMYKNTEPDGLTLLMVPTGKIWLGWLMKEKNVYYDASKFEYLPGIQGGPYILNVPVQGKYTTIETFKKGKRLRMPCSNKTSIMALAGMAACEIFNLNDAMTIQGFKTSERFIALKQGEAEATVSSLEVSLIQQRAGMSKLLFQIGLDRNPKAPDLPSIAELAKLSDYHRKLLSVLFKEARVFMAPPGVPKDRLKFLEDAITKVLNIKEFEQIVEKNSGIWYGICDRADVRKSIDDLAANKANIDLYAPLMKKYVK